jgi:AcrR family transcriptional regulator
MNDSKEKIFISAKKLFAKNGYDGTSIRDICHDAGVVICSVHYYFGNKKALFKEVLRSLGEERLQHILEILTSVETFDELRIRLEIFLDSAISSMLTEPIFFRFILKEVESVKKENEDIYKNVFFKIFEHIVLFFEIVRKQNMIASELEPKFIARMLLNHIFNQIRSEELNKHYFNISLSNLEFRKEWINSTIFVFLHGIRNREFS